MPVKAKETASSTDSAAEEKVTFAFDGSTYTAPVDMDLDALEEWEKNNLASFMQLVVGDPEYKEFRKTHSKTTQLRAFAVAYFNAVDDRG